MMPHESSTRRFRLSTTEGKWLTKNHRIGPVRTYTGCGARWSKTRAPVHVTPNDRNRTALARSIETKSDTDPYIPNSAIDADRIRCAQPHHATARICVF